tara:strand:+ start:261 stop:1214 length:954 start_codon:yes stop_codon:yes gene_type:complete
MKQDFSKKPIFDERMKSLLGKDFENYEKAAYERLAKSIRVNTLKISPENLRKKLEKKKWEVEQPFKEHPEIMFVKSDLEPGELGRSLEHLLGYYYIQEISSMLPTIALNPKPNETILDLCASPGSKTTQIAAKMENTGVIIANDLKLGRIRILASNLERCGVTNTIITKADGIGLCKRLKEDFQIDKILLDAPCSGEGTIGTSKESTKMWNLKKINSLSKIQKNLFSSAFELLKPGGEMVYSTCTYAPEENEEVIDFILKKFPNIKIEKITLPIKFRGGITNWEDKEYVEDVKYSCRIFPQDNKTGGFFIAKFKKAL